MGNRKRNLNYEGSLIVAQYIMVPMPTNVFTPNLVQAYPGRIHGQCQKDFNGFHSWRNINKSITRQYLTAFLNT